MIMAIEVIRAAISDINDIITIQNNAFEDDFIKYGECPAYHEQVETIEDLIRNGIVYLIKDGHSLIGSASLRVRSENELYLRTFAILPGYHNKGFGSAALIQIESLNKYARKWTLITPDDNPRNKRFYEKNGYIKYGDEFKSFKLTLAKYMKTI